MSMVTTFGIFQSLLTRAVTDDASLNEATKASMLTRINQLTRGVEHRLDHSNVKSASGNASVDSANNAIAIADGATSRVEWNERQFTVPVDIDGTRGETGFLAGTGGDKGDPLVALTDIALQYRLSATGVWQAFNRTTLLRDVEWIQFAADIADPTTPSVLPQINLVTVQV